MLPKSKMPKIIAPATEDLFLQNLLKASLRKVVGLVKNLVS